MKNRKISVIVPCFNVEHYISRCLDSIIAQTIFSSIKVICIDDGSTDGTLRLLEDYQSKFDNITVIHQVNSGQSKARNVGLLHVDTPYVGFIDSDDWINEQYYESLYNSIIKSNADLAICRMVSIFDNGTIDESNARGYPIDDFDCFELSSQQAIKNIVKLFLRDRLSVSPCNKLIKFELLQDVKYPEGLYNEDMEFTLNLWLKAKTVVKTNIGVYYYWQRAISTTKINSLRVLDMNVIVNRITLLIKSKFPGSLERELIDFKLFFSIYLTCLRIRKSDRAVKKEVIYALSNELMGVSIYHIVTSSMLTMKKKIGIVILKCFPSSFVVFWR